MISSSASTRTPDSLVETLETVASLVERLCRRYGLRGAEAEDCVSWIRMRILENDSAVLSKFRGESRFVTFLGAVVANLMRDYLDKIWGRWRPSAVAKSYGPLAVALEASVVRDGTPLRAAVERLRSSGFPGLTDRTAVEIVARLPQRGRPMFVGDQLLSGLPAGEWADAHVLERDREAAWDEVLNAVDRALDDLSSEDRVIVELRFREGLSVADVARALGLPQKPLYRRINRLLETLRASPHLEGLSLPELGNCVPRDRPWS